MCMYIANHETLPLLFGFLRCVPCCTCVKMQICRIALQQRVCSLVLCAVLTIYYIKAVNATSGKETHTFDSQPPPTPTLPATIIQALTLLNHTREYDVRVYGPGYV